MNEEIAFKSSGFNDETQKINNQQIVLPTTSCEQISNDYTDTNDKENTLQPVVAKQNSTKPDYEDCKSLNSLQN